MCKFTNHNEPWGQFLDVKVNAAEILSKEIRKKPVGKIFFSSACDGWQPAERKYELTRRCLKIAAEAEFPIMALTKSRLVERDIDVFSSAKNAALGFTITTLDETIRRRIEIAASSSEERIKVLEKARSHGIKTWAFCGPLLPGLTDNYQNIASIFRRLIDVGVDSIVVDKLNFRSGVYESIMSMLSRCYPELIPKYNHLFRYEQEYRKYIYDLKSTVYNAVNDTGYNGELDVVCK